MVRKRFLVRGALVRSIFVVLALVAAVSVLAAGCGGGGDSGGIPKDAMAQVGENVITQAEFDERIKSISIQYEGKVPTKDDGEAYKPFQISVLDYMVNLEVLRQKQAEFDVTVTQEDVDAELDTIKAMFNGDEAAFQEALDAQKLTLDALKSQVEEQLLIQKMNDAVTKDVTVSDEEIKAYYDAHQDEFKQEETRQVRHILFSPGSDPDAADGATEADWQAAKAEAEAVRAKIKNGEDFGELAKANSDDPGTKELGGDLGFISEGMMVPEFDESVFSMEAGQVSDPVRTQFGYHIIQLQEITPAGALTLEEGTEQIKAQLLSEKKSKVWEEWLANAMKELGVTYKEGFSPTTTTTGEGATTTTTTGGATEGETTTTEAANTTTTAQ